MSEFFSNFTVYFKLSDMTSNDKLAERLERWQSLDELLRYFSTETRCRDFLLSILYPDGIRCPKCGGIIVYKSGRIFHCEDCNHNFSVTVGTIFQSTKLPLRKWFAAIWLMIHNKKGCNSCMLSRQLGITQTSAWHMLHKIRRTLPQSSDRLGGPVQIDAAYVGGLLRWVAHKPSDSLFGDYLRNKVSVLGMSGDRLFMRALDDTRWSTIKPVLTDTLTADAIVYSDQGKEFLRIGRDLGLLHLAVDHSRKQFSSDSGASTNRVEGAWAHLKRQTKGIYHLMPRKYAQYYIDEFVWRWNTRSQSTVDRTRDYFPNTRVVITWKMLREA